MAECAAAAAAPAAIGADQHPAARRAGQLLAVLPSSDTGLCVVSASVNVTPIRIDAVFAARPGPAGAGEVHDVEIVGVVQVVKLRSPQYLGFLIEGGVVAEVQVIKVAEFIEGNDVGDFIAMEV